MKLFIMAMWRPYCYLSIFLAVLLSLQVQSQNLVADSSFERNKEIPIALSAINLNGSWSAPTRGTTDLFCECNKKEKETSEAQVPANTFGTQKANTGKCYAGLYGFSHGDYREYLMTQLIEPLRAGVKYEFFMYVSLSDYSRVAIDQIGICFLKNKLSIDNSDVIVGLNPIYIKINEEVGKDTVNWHLLNIEFVAKGGEKFLLIGSFEVNDIELTKVKAPPGVRTRINQRTERDAYYYIDDVTLREYTPPVSVKIDTTVIAKVDTLRTAPLLLGADSSNAGVVLNKPIILKNVLFETNEAILLPASFPELDAAADYLLINRGVKIQVSGHTDNVGNEEKNLILSEKRAKAVADYLVTKSIDPGRISYKGYGSQKPIADNSSEPGRKQNRRVELLFGE